MLRKILMTLTILTLAVPLAGPAAAETPGEAPAVAECAADVESAGTPGAALLDLAGLVPAVQRVETAGCDDFYPCETASDCPCDAPDCACISDLGGCGFDYCLCRTYCFEGGQQP